MPKLLTLLGPHDRNSLAARLNEDSDGRQLLTQLGRSNVTREEAPGVLRSCSEYLGPNDGAARVSLGAIDAQVAAGDDLRPRAPKPRWVHTAQPPWTPTPEFAGKDKRVHAHFMAQHPTGVGLPDPYQRPYSEYKGDFRVTFRQGRPCQRAAVTPQNPNGFAAPGRYKGILVLGRKRDAYKLYAKTFDATTACGGENPAATRHTAFRQDVDPTVGAGIFVGIQLWVDDDGYIERMSCASGHYGGYRGGHLGTDTAGSRYLGHDDAVARLKQTGVLLAQLGMDPRATLEDVELVTLSTDTTGWQSQIGTVPAGVRFSEYGKTAVDGRETTVLMKSKSLGTVDEIRRSEKVDALQL